MQSSHPLFGLILVPLLAFGQPLAVAEEELAVAAYPCEHKEGFRDFDFWLGEWDVHVASGQIHDVSSDTTLPFRGLWTLLDDGRVRQFFEQSHDGGTTWTTWFEGSYTRTEDQAAQ